MYGEGPSIKYVTLFWPIFTPSPCHTLSHIPSTPKKVRHTSRTPNPHFLVGLVQKPGQKPSVQILSQFFAGFLSGGFCQEVFCPKGFVRGGFCPFPLLSEYICYSRKLNITLNFMFHMYDKNNKCDVTCSWPSHCHKLSHLPGTPPPRAWRTLWTPQMTVFEVSNGVQLLSSL